jgi:hypothetical protein
MGYTGRLFAVVAKTHEGVRQWAVVHGGKDGGDEDCAGGSSSSSEESGFDLFPEDARPENQQREEEEEEERQRGREERREWLRRYEDGLCLGEEPDDEFDWFALESSSQTDGNQSEATIDVLCKVRDARKRGQYRHGSTSDASCERDKSDGEDDKNASSCDDVIKMG